DVYKRQILVHITKKNRVNRFIFLVIGAFIVALIYNCFIVPNNLVFGGIGGLAIIVNKVFNVNINLFINVVTVFLIIISLILMGAKHTSYSIIGFAVYTLMINLTSPLSTFINIRFESFLFAVIINSIIMGFGYGLIYRTGFNTGGSDSIVQIIQHFFHLPMGQVSNVINGIIVIIGAINFGIIKTIYAIIFLKIMNYISDYIILGVSTSKLCYIKTKQTKEVEEYLSNNLSMGYSLIESTNGIGMLRKPIIFVVVPNDYFYHLKEEVLKIDKNAKFISNDCYTVENGHMNKIIKI
ncbi:MAG: YitT family protein, partial [Bacilli bacterium]|nr:YitT family protein [Bacilli bacterium]